MDQVPCSFALGHANTFTFKGDKRVQVALPKAGLEKRQCTLQLCFRPGGRQPIAKGAIIFRGQGLRISLAEKAAWDKRVDVYFQPKAWVDRDIACSWLERTFNLAHHVAVEHAEDEEILLIM